MYERFRVGWLVLAATFVFLTREGASGQTVSDERIVSYSVDLNKQPVGLYWKDDSGASFGNFQRFERLAGASTQEAAVCDVEDAY
jgi:uncharacterized protein YigE (DUF2233 family)